jgi:hypothetical protein
VAGTLAFGSQLADFRTLWDSIVFHFFLFIGIPQVSYQTLETHNTVLAPLFYYPCMFIFQIFLSRMLLAIVIHTYEKITKKN